MGCQGLSAPSEHTGNCISFTLDKGSYNPVERPMMVQNLL